MMEFFATVGIVAIFLAVVYGIGHWINTRKRDK